MAAMAASFDTLPEAGAAAGELPARGFGVGAAAGELPARGLGVGAAVGEGVDVAGGLVGAGVGGVAVGEGVEMDGTAVGAADALVWPIPGKRDMPVASEQPVSATATNSITANIVEARIVNHL